MEIHNSMHYNLHEFHTSLNVLNNMQINTYVWPIGVSRVNNIYELCLIHRLLALVISGIYNEFLCGFAPKWGPGTRAGCLIQLLDLSVSLPHQWKISAR